MKQQPEKIEVFDVILAFLYQQSRKKSENKLAPMLAY
jgi:hypothetical protein